MTGALQFPSTEISLSTLEILNECCVTEICFPSLYPRKTFAILIIDASANM
jgi:hypothetical protein